MTSKNIRILLYNVIIVLQGNIPSCISSLLFVADHHTESLVLKSPVYDNKVSFKVNISLIHVFKGIYYPVFCVFVCLFVCFISITDMQKRHKPCKKSPPLHQKESFILWKIDTITMTS